MTGRKGHLRQIHRVPCGYDHSSTLWIGFKLLNDCGQLVHALARVVRRVSPVISPEVSPLETVDWPQVALLMVIQSPSVQELSGRVPAPNVDSLVG